MCQILDHKLEIPNFSAVRTGTITYDTYTNDRHHRLGFPTVVMILKDSKCTITFEMLILYDFAFSKLMNR